MQLMHSSNLNCTLRVLFGWWEAACPGNNTGGLQRSTEIGWWM